MNFGARLFDFGEGEAGAARQFFGRARGRDAETRLLEQRHAEQPLELTRRAMDARLRHLARPRGDAEIAVLDHGVERFELRRTHQPFRIGDAFGGGAARGFASASRNWVSERSMRPRQISPAFVSDTPVLRRSNSGESK